MNQVSEWEKLDKHKQIHPLFQTVFKTFLKDKEKIVNALQLPYSNAKLEATNNLIKLIKLLSSKPTAQVAAHLSKRILLLP